jgi:hypothetical protein
MTKYKAYDHTDKICPMISSRELRSCLEEECMAYYEDFHNDETWGWCAQYNRILWSDELIIDE